MRTRSGRQIPSGFSLEQIIMEPSYGRSIWALLLVIAVLSLGLAPASHAKLTDPQKLVSFLKVQLPGWKVKDGYPKFERVKNKGQSYVEAQVIYTSGKSTVTVVIMEGGGIAAEVAKVRKFALADNEKGYCRKTAVQGFEAVEMVSKNLKSAFLFILVGDQCLVTMKVTDAEDTKVLKELGNKINLPKFIRLIIFKSLPGFRLFASPWFY